MSASGWTWRDASSSAQMARWGLYAAAALDACAVLFGLAFAADKSMEGPAAILALVQFLVFLVAAILFLRWLYLANNNARAIGANDLNGSPGWAVGWFFVPFANLVMPYMTVRDMWKASLNPKDWQAESSPPLVGLWWACWLISSIAGTIAFRIELEMGLGAAEGVRALTLASDLISIPSALLLATIVQRIQAQQTAAWPASAF